MFAKTKKYYLFVLVLLLVFITAAGAWLFSTSEKLYRTYSPDRQYSVYASTYNFYRLIPSFPGGGGDAPGRVVLFDEVENKVIASARIPILWLAQDIQWEQNQAYFIGDTYPTILDPWLLPRPLKLD